MEMMMMALLTGFLCSAAFSCRWSESVGVVWAITEMWHLARVGVAARGVPSAEEVPPKRVEGPSQRSRRADGAAVFIFARKACPTG